MTAAVSQSELAVSVVICTHNPRWDIFSRALDSIAAQTLDRQRFELIVVDNNSRQPLSEAKLTRNGLRPIVLREPRAGLSRARCKGIAAARGKLFVFVDDDNFLAADYLENALKILESEGRLGAYGGIADAELEAPIAEWKRAFLPYLGVRNNGPAPITAFADYWGDWEPIGAGMVTRRDVAEKFVELFNTLPDARLLGRRGNALLSGEDSLFARAAHRLGYCCSYQPSLRLTHYIKKDRLKIRYLTRLLEGHGRSYVLLHRALDMPTEALKVRTAVARLGYRVKTAGAAGFITWFWDLGYAFQKRKTTADATGHAGDSVPPA